jgi:hypothetical protein
MSVHSFVKVLILMIVIQSGIVAADVHSVVPEHAPEQHLHNDDLNDGLQDQAQNTGEHNSSSADGCAFCMHCHCSHFTAINTSADIDVYPRPDNFFYPYQLASVTDYSVSMYRPPKS